MAFETVTLPAENFAAMDREISRLRRERYALLDIARWMVKNEQFPFGTDEWDMMVEKSKALIALVESPNPSQGEK